jgi:GH35 family endo-1,4-beta-xylanase
MAVWRRWVMGVCWASAMCVTQVVDSQTNLVGNSLTYRSTGTSSGSDWILDRNGYVGTYIKLDEPGSVTVNVSAAGTASGGIDPHMNIVLADTKAGFDVSGGFNSYEQTFDLPAGTYFLRTELNNDTEVSARELTIRDMTITGATVSNTSVTATNSANALAAADTYIQNFRRGNVKIGLSGVAPGSEVEVSLKRHAFNFGTAVPGTSFNSVNSFLGSGGTARQTNYQARLLQLFNAVVPENAGKWGTNEGSQGNENISNIDLILDFAQAHSLAARMHNLIWGDNSGNGQQPGWVLNDSQNGLLDLAATGDATAAAELRGAISHRIDYYVGDGPGGLEDQAPRIAELDVYNESIHTGSSPGGLTHNYWTAYGPDGVAGIYHEVKQAVEEAGASTRLYVNEYNVIGSSTTYVRHIDTLRQAAIDAGYGDILGGIGAQYYPSSPESPATVMASMQDFAVQGLPFTLTEFGVASGVPAATAADIMEEILRLVFGNPDSTGFFMWGFHQGGGSNLFAPAAALFNVNFSGTTWTITPAGTRYEWLFGLAPDSSKRGDNASPWNTQLTAVVGDDGTIDFDGFWGDYELTVGGQSYDLALEKGTSLYSLVVAPGDYNGDGTVDAADYVVWRSAVGSDDLRADGNGDRIIDTADYDVWRAHFGASYKSSGNGALNLPEPACAMTLFAGAVAAASLRCRTMATGGGNKSADHAHHQRESRRLR